MFEPSTQSGFVIRHVDDSMAVPCPCGISMRPLPAQEGKACSLHVTSITDSARHYHKQTAEVYYILEGEGTIELNGKIFAIRPGMMIAIDPGTRHKVMSKEGIRTIVVAIPPFDAADEFFD